MVDISCNLSNILVEIQGAGGASLVAVSKFQPAEKISEALDAGHRLFGENRVQEALLKWPCLKNKYDGVELHLIGPLQTNKIKEAFKIFDVIEVLDRKKLADAIKKEADKSGKNVECYIQINTGGEEQKAGVFPQDADEFIEYCKSICLNITGLMCIPPVNEAPAPHFTMLAQLAKKHNLPNISMGMSGDYLVAIKHGATHVRVGSAIFGNRS